MVVLKEKVEEHLTMKRARYIGLDLLRGIAAFGIVGCHLSLTSRTDGGNLVTALCDFNVGLFAAVAGFLMCGGGKSDSWLEYVGKRARRLLPTYFFWSAMFILATSTFDLLLDGGHLNPKYGTVSFWGKVIFAGDAATHLWFLVCLFYAQVGLWRCLKSCEGRRYGLIWIGLGGLAIAGSVVLGGWFGMYPLRLLAFVMTGYGIGCWLCEETLDFFRRHRDVVWLVVVGVLVGHVMARGMVPGFIRDWIAVVPVLLAFVILDSGKEKFVKITTFLGATSMGVYLVHPLITRGLSVVVTRLSQPPFSAQIVLAEWLLAWVISLAATYVLGRLPVVRRFV